MKTNQLITNVEIQNKKGDTSRILNIDKDLCLTSIQKTTYDEQGRKKVVILGDITKVYNYNKDICMEYIKINNVTIINNIYQNDKLIYQYDIKNDLISLYEYDDKENNTLILTKDIITDDIVSKVTSTYRDNKIKEKKLYSMNDEDQLTLSIKKVYKYENEKIIENVIIPKLNSKQIYVTTEEDCKYNNEHRTLLFTTEI